MEIDWNYEYLKRDVIGEAVIAEQRGSVRDREEAGVRRMVALETMNANMTGDWTTPMTEQRADELMQMIFGGADE